MISGEPVRRQAVRSLKGVGHLPFSKFLLTMTTLRTASRSPAPPAAASASFRSLAVALALAGSAPVAIAAPLPQDPCATSQVLLDTGYDHVLGTTLPIGSIDARWIVVQDPTANTAEPRPATVIQKNAAWRNPEPGSQWISGYPTSAQTLNGTYVFETTFCLRPGAVLSQCSLQIGMRADDACRAYLNGTLIHTGQAFGAPIMTTSTYALTSTGLIGTNVLRVEVDNLFSVAMGLNLKATVFAAPNNTAEKPECCSGRGALQGMKYNDLNGNGQRDAGEPPLPGWQIGLYQSGSLVASATTDSQGYYNFTNLLPGSYAISETQQGGWTQTAPLGGTHFIYLSALQGINGLDFGNRNVQPCFEPDFGVQLGGGDDVTLPLTTLGIVFPFAGSTYTDFYASTNGFLYLRNGPAGTTPSSRCCVGSVAAALANTSGPMICPFWTDLFLAPANAGQVCVKYTPSATIITWMNAMEYGDTQNHIFHVQAKLHLNGQIDFSYTTGMAMRTNGAAFVGVCPGGGGSDPGQTNLSAGGTTASDTTYELFDNVSLPFDLTGSLVTMQPLLPGRNIGYSPCSWAVAASLARHGVGCVMHPKLRYETFDVARPFDLNLWSLMFVRLADGYSGLPVGGTFVPPSGAATVLALGDDAEATVALSMPMPAPNGVTTALTICSNGFVSTAPGNGTAAGPAATLLRSRPQPMFANWCDYDPSRAGSGQVKFEEVGGVAYVTWDGVYRYNTNNPDTFQFQFDLATGNVTIVWSACANLDATRLVGATTGGAVQDPGSTDWSALGSSSVKVHDVEGYPLGIVASGRPVPGGVVSLDAVNVPGNAMVGAILLGFTQFNPGLPLDALGMPGCFQYNEGSAVHLFVAPGTGTAMALPMGTLFLGVHLQAQAVVLAPGYTPLGAVSSGGIELQIGY